jgi:hypothetical protein
MAVTLLFKKNYLAMVRNAAKGENHTFQNFFISVDGQEKDALKGGALGCGTVFSAILYLQNSTLEFLNKPRWISFVHANVPAVEKDMQENGWYQIPELREGAVITCEQKPGADGTLHFHIGFYIGNQRAVTNDSNGTLMPTEVHSSFNGTRNIIRTWWHPELDEA